MSEIVEMSHKELIDPQAQMVVDFLENMGLPHENIIADASERDIIGQTLPGLINGLGDEVKKEARYLSKFIVGAGFGLFDYSLNAIWNEVTLDLRKKAIAYGIDIFYDAAVGGKAREFYKSEDDLPSIKESVLLDTSRKLELISDTTYKKLKHMLDMRNNIGISHPTNYDINAFELLGWLQNAIKDVLSDQPTESALKVQAFINNLKTNSELIDLSTQKSIEGKICELDTHHISHILRTLFGIFVTSNTRPEVRKNISILLPIIWNNCNNESKYKLGIILEGYNNNLYREKYQLGEEFFKIVNGNSFRSTSERIIIVDNLLDELLEKHNGWDNFHNEAIVADSISTYILDQNDILINNIDKFAKVILMCRIGKKDVGYNNGISPQGKLYYDNFLSMIGDQYVAYIMAALSHYEIQRKLGSRLCRKNAKESLQLIKPNIVNSRLIECLDYLIDNIEKDSSYAISDEFKKLSNGYITW